MAVVLILPNIGHLLPLDDQSNTHSKEINSSIKHSIPLVLNAVTVWLTLAYFWTNYASIAATTSSLIAGVICLGFLTSSSIQASHEMIHRP